MGSNERSRIRVGVIGTGFAASSHLDALARLRGVEVAGILGSAPERSRAAAERLGVGRAYPGLEALLDDDSVDAVHNCTPNHLHAGITERSLAAGKHVLSEKPLALDPEEGARLVSAADRANVVTGVCFNYRHFPLVQQARAMVRGELGPVHLAHGSYLQDWLLEKDDWNWRLEADKAGATRASGDIGSHWVDTVEHVMGDRVEEVMADLGRLHDERLRPAGEVRTFERSPAERVPTRVDTEDFASVLLRFRGGCRGAFTVSQVSPGRKNRLWFEMDGARAALAWDQEDPNRLWIGRRDAANAQVMRDPSLLVPQAAALAHFPGGHEEGWPDALRNLFEDFYAAVSAHRDRRPHQRTFATFGEAQHVTEVIAAIARSDRDRSWVPVGAAAMSPSEQPPREVVS